MRRFVSLAFAISALASPLAAQSHPDFSGKWVMDPKTAEGPMAPSAMTLTATQDAKTFKVETAATSQFGDQKATSTVNLDGTPTKNTYDTPNGAAGADVRRELGWCDARHHDEGRRRRPGSATGRSLEPRRRRKNGSPAARRVVRRTERDPENDAGEAIARAGHPEGDGAKPT